MKLYKKKDFEKIEFIEVGGMHFAMIVCRDPEIKTNGMWYDYANFFFYEFSPIHGEGEYKVNPCYFDDEWLLISNDDHEVTLDTEDSFLTITLGKYPFMDIDRHKSQSLVCYVPALMRIARESYISLDWNRKDNKFDYREFYY